MELRLFVRGCSGSLCYGGADEAVEYNGVYGGTRWGVRAFTEEIGQEMPFIPQYARSLSPLCVLVPDKREKDVSTEEGKLGNDNAAHYSATHKGN